MTRNGWPSVPFPFGAKRALVGVDGSRVVRRGGAFLGAVPGQQSRTVSVPSASTKAGFGVPIRYALRARFGGRMRDALHRRRAVLGFALGALHRKRPGRVAPAAVL